MSRGTDEQAHPSNGYLTQLIGGDMARRTTAATLLVALVATGCGAGPGGSTATDERNARVLEYGQEGPVMVDPGPLLHS